MYMQFCKNAHVIDEFCLTLLLLIIPMLLGYKNKYFITKIMIKSSFMYIAINVSKASIEVN